MVAGYLVTTTPPEELTGDQPRALPRARRDRDGSRRFFVTSYTNHTGKRPPDLAGQPRPGAHRVMGIKMSYFGYIWAKT